MVARLGKMIWSLLLFALSAYAVILVALFLLQRQMIYVPDRSDLADDLAPDSPFQVVESETADGLRLRHLWTAPTGNPGPVFVVLHGNAGHAGHRTEKFDFLRQAGAGVLLAEYRGYGGNPGSPSETGLYADARSTLAWLGEQGIGPDRVVLYGESLGSGVATKIAAELAERGTPLKALVLEAPFTSVAAVAQRRFWWLPATWLTRDRFDSLARIGDVGTELLIFHGTEDKVVPFDMGVALSEAAEARAQDRDGAAAAVDFLSVDGGGHLYLADQEPVRRRLLALAQSSGEDD